MFSAAMNFMQLTLSNRKAQPIGRISLDNSGASQQSYPFPEVAALAPGQSMAVQLHVDFGGSTSPARFTIKHDGGSFPLAVVPPAGELVRPAMMSEPEFLAKQAGLGGMHECKSAFASASAAMAAGRVVQMCNLAVVASAADFASSGTARFAGETLQGSQQLLVTITANFASGQGVVQVNCADPMFGSSVAGFIAAGLR
jgi:hypothetical protein